MKSESPHSESMDSFDLPLDTAAGEHRVAGEEEAIRKTTEMLLRVVGKAYGGGKTKALRDVHAVSHGCVHAKVSVPKLADDLRHGFFAREASYDAVIRFSNGDGVGAGQAPDADSKSMMRGMAIKVLGVEGRKLLGFQQHATTQDFLLVNRPEFFLRNIFEYTGAMERVGRGLLGLAEFALHHPQAAYHLIRGGILLKFDDNQIDNPLNTTYFSKLPFRFGPLVVKYRARPCKPVPVVIPSDPPPRYLRAAMKAQLDPSTDGDKERACFVFEIQRHKDEPLEDATAKWDAPFEEVARISIPKQDFDTDAENTACENLSFSPWHALAEHRPLGSLNRGRKVVYQVLSKFRHDENGAPLREP